MNISPREALTKEAYDELGHLDDPQVPFVPAAARPKTPVRDLPKAKPGSGMFDPQAVAEALGGAA